MGIEELAKLFLSVGGTGGIVWFVAKLIVKNWFDKVTEIETLKKANQKLATDRAKEIIDELNKETRLLKIRMGQIGEKIVECNLKITGLQIELRNTIDKQEEFKESIKQTVKMEVIELSKAASLYRTKKTRG
jgi:Pyruvate/2-oxoacid:ferredoxin oxidoreductase gamma subunit